MHNPRICCLCRKQIDIQPSGWAEGHNAAPFMNGRCCSECNNTLVIPDRIALAGAVREMSAGYAHGLSLSRRISQEARQAKLVDETESS